MVIEVPGRIVKRADADVTVVTAIQHRLNDLRLLWPIACFGTVPEAVVCEQAECIQWTRA